jgi:hypothetical protein
MLEKLYACLRVAASAKAGRKPLAAAKLKRFQDHIKEPFGHVVSFL